MSPPESPWRRILLAYNPAAGRTSGGDKRLRRLVDFLSSAVPVLELVTLNGHGPGAVIHDVKSFDAVFVCGGDGTLNQMLQFLAESKAQIPVGIIPVGSGNLLSSSLQTPAEPVSAATALLAGEARQQPLGTITTADGRLRYWVAAAGIGADANVICGVSPRWKARMGQAAYYAESIRQLCSPRLELPWFCVELLGSDGSRRIERATQVIAERISYFGKAVSKAPHPLRDDEMRVILIKSSTRWALLRYGTALFASKFGAVLPASADIETMVVKEVLCTPLPESRTSVLAEVDGELVGPAPVRLTVQSSAATLILPRN